MTAPHPPELPPRPRFIERQGFDERNSVLYLVLGLVAVAERVLSVVPELVEPPPEPAPPAPTAAEATARLLR
jgi:hypothetical protein